MEKIFVSSKNNIIYKEKHYIDYEFVKKYLTPIQLLQMGIDDYAEILKSKKQSVKQLDNVKKRYSSSYVGGKRNL